MEIAPIAGVRGLSLMGVQRTTSAMTPGFAPEATARIDDETYSQGRQTADRGLEDEESSSTDEEEKDRVTEPAARNGDAHLSCFA